MREMRIPRRASSLARNCARADSFKRRMRPQRSTSQDELKAARKLLPTVPLPEVLTTPSAEIKAPGKDQTSSTNIQAPEKHQVSNYKDGDKNARAHHGTFSQADFDVWTFFDH